MSPYRDPRVIAAVAGLTAGGVGLIVLVNETTDGATRTVATLAVAAALWIGLMAVLRIRRRGS